MRQASIYWLHGPSAWPERPARFSFSSLATIENCPLQWQLAHAEYQELARFPARPHPAAVEGDIVHRTLDRLFRSLALAGLPEIGTAEFREEVGRVDVRRTVENLIFEHEARLARHPRGAGFRLRLGPQQVVNRVIRLFRAEYSKAVAGSDGTPPVRSVHASGEPSGGDLLGLLHSRYAVSELRLVHPTLPLVGIIDLVRAEGDTVVILDFKTGEQKPTHEAQVLFYAILWWRKTCRAPERVEVRYPSGARRFPVDERVLADEERKLGRRIDNVASALADPPAGARLGDHCRFCDVRQFCDAYWRNSVEELPAQKAKVGKSIDVELTVDGTPSNNGFSARTRNGSSCSVVHALDGSKVHGPFIEGETLRILNTRLADTNDALELMAWTETFHQG